MNLQDLSKNDFINFRDQRVTEVGSGAFVNDWRQQAMETLDYSPEQIEKIIQTEFDQMSKLIRTTGMKLE